jgi:hypothetical protein
VLRRQRVRAGTAAMHMPGLEQRAYTAVILEAQVKRPIASGSEPLRTTPVSGLISQNVRQQSEVQLHCHVPTAIESTSARANKRLQWANRVCGSALSGLGRNDGTDKVRRHILIHRRGCSCVHVTAHKNERDPLDFRGPGTWDVSGVRGGEEARSETKHRTSALDQRRNRAGVRDSRSARGCT